MLSHVVIISIASCLISSHLTIVSICIFSLISVPSDILILCSWSVHILLLNEWGTFRGEWLVVMIVKDIWGREGNELSVRISVTSITSYILVILYLGLTKLLLLCYLIMSSGIPKYSSCLMVIRCHVTIRTDKLISRAHKVIRLIHIIVKFSFWKWKLNVILVFHLLLSIALLNMMTSLTLLVHWVLLLLNLCWLFSSLKCVTKFKLHLWHRF